MVAGMKNEVTIKKVNGWKVVRLRGGRPSHVCISKKVYTRKSGKAVPNE